jgi:uncharacterized protein
MAAPLAPDFWLHKTLDEMTPAEWEALCDGCGKCCLLKLEFEETGELAFTDVSCKLLDTETARCCDYPNRVEHVPDCVKLTAQNVDELSFMPPSCAYRLLSEGKPLRKWHPLVSGDPDSVHKAGMSVRNRVISEILVPDEQDLLAHIVKWPTRR